MTEEIQDSSALEAKIDTLPLEETNPPEKQVEEIPEEKPQVESVQATNFKTLRKATAKAERERDDAIARLKEAQKSSSASPSTKKKPSNIAEQIKDLEFKIQQQQLHTEAITTETTLRQQYSDFDQIVNKENLAFLKDSYPELASTIHASNNLHDKAVAAYTMIKRLGLTPSAVTPEQEKISSNLSKPRSANSASPQSSSTPLSRIDEFSGPMDSATKRRIWNEMDKLSKR